MLIYGHHLLTAMKGKISSEFKFQIVPHTSLSSGFRRQLLVPDMVVLFCLLWCNFMEPFWSFLVTMNHSFILFFILL